MHRTWNTLALAIHVGQKVFYGDKISHIDVLEILGWHCGNQNIMSMRNNSIPLLVRDKV